MQIHERLKSAREDADLTQEQAAKAIESSRTQIHRYETGEQTMTIKKLKTLCLLYNVSSDYVLGLPRGMPWPR